MTKDEPTTGDEAFGRLTAADPGADAEPRTGVLRAKVDAQLESWVPDPVLADELADRREAPVRRRRRILVAAAVAGAVVVGGSGYVLGTVTGSGSGADAASVADAAGFARPGSADDVIAAREGAGDDAAGDSAASDGAGDGAQEESLAVQDAPVSTRAGTSDMYWGQSFEHTTFRAQGLSEQGGTATAYALDARAAVNAETAARAAAALGVPGEVRDDGWTLAVGDPDGTGPQLWLGVDGTASLGFSDPSLDPWMCMEPDADGVCPVPPATTVDDVTAATMLADAMRALGVDPAQFEVSVEPRSGDDDAVRWVVARQVVGGTLTGASWSASVTDAGLANLHGSLAAVVELGSYEVISPAEAVARLGDPRFASTSPIAYGRDAMAEPADEPRVPEVPAPPSAGSSIAWPVTDVTITGARLGLTQHWTASGAVLFVPAYELTDDAGNTWSVIAVAESGLDLAGR
ncbi:hypothetical protein Xcel_3018 [Xylanimonas cellulosilytica DSM 15894]|uniref:Uncharacterized protein n=1 Tax=Xylanimonas cellulosilytica (strain DSM 15894 / JCM 12276 / CECT 5975 / KCTC 9989 / LMG 20990 / NBRC 107835 / XIL07) TaxID=446471 RepID=D1BZC7_XYLCX|nr:hypothetical protein [Xylanimonas cellulosilytica]ACZ32024.1 hypothetical protein Xcel_3018 [Xylanimonas cellulosilytica DSM 15894]